MKTHSDLIILAVLIVFACLITGCTRAPKREELHAAALINLPILAPAPDLLKDFRVEVFCSETKIRTGVAIITWNADSQVIDKQRLDVTFYKKGFEKNLYTTLWPLQKDQKFQTSSQVKLPDRADFQTLYLNVDEVKIMPQEGAMSVRLEGLVPGTNYFWRVCTLSDGGWAPSDNISVEGPICPADLIEEKQQR
jgi:hypothetical protein